MISALALAAAQVLPAMVGQPAQAAGEQVVVVHVEPEPRALDFRQTGTMVELVLEGTSAPVLDAPPIVDAIRQLRLERMADGVKLQLRLVEGASAVMQQPDAHTVTVTLHKAGTGRAAGLRPGLAAPSAVEAAAAQPAQAGEPGQGLHLLDAVRSALELQPDIQILGQRVEAAEGDLLVQSGAFDLVLGSNVSQVHDNSPLNSTQAVPGVIDALESDSTRLTVSASQQTRSGLSLSPSFTFSKDTNNLPSSVRENRLTFRMTATQPLLRGRGRDVVAAGEDAQHRELEATRSEYRYGVSQSILFAVQSYWNYLAAVRAYEILAESEQRYAGMRDEAMALIEADQIPAADSKQLSANLASRTGSRLQAEQRLFEARQGLGLAMGLQGDEITRLPLPSEDFPAVPEAGRVARGQESLFIGTALERRGDLAAARLRVEAADILLGAARNGLKPRVDLQLQAGYKGLAEGDGFSRFFSPLYDNTSGLDAGAALVFSFPPRNRAAQGRLARNMALSEQARTAAWDTERQIASALAVAVSNLATAAERVGIAAETTRLFYEAVDDEGEKVRQGIGTVIDLIFTQDSLTQAQIDEVQARLAYANAVARLRFETGTLVSGDPAAREIDEAALTTTPQPGR